MNAEPFIAPFAKVERAKNQIHDLDGAIAAFFKTATYAVVSKVDRKADEEVWSFKLKSALPHDIAVRTGEILHNLRSSLDQMLVEVIVAGDGGAETGIEFPFGIDQEKFETALGKQKKRLPPDAIPLIEALRPYKGGDHLLWLLHSTNRGDKHRIGLVPVNLRTGGRNSFLSTWNGQALVVGSRQGQHMTVERWVTPAKLLKLHLENKPTGLYGLCRLHPITGEPVVPSPMVISYENNGPGTAEQSYEFLTTTPGTRFKTDFEPSFDVAFRDVGGLEREPIVHVLTQLRDLVENVLLKFRDRFFPLSV